MSKLPNGKTLDLAAIDRNADACSDFYQYACGSWIKSNPLPNDEVRWDRGSIVRSRNQFELWQRLVQAAANPTSSLEQKYGDYFAACMDVGELEIRGLQPLKPAFEHIAAIKDSKDVAKLIRDLAVDAARSSPLGIDVEPDPTDSSKPILSITQGGITLPDRDNYSGNSPYVVKRYRAHMVRVFMLAGDTLQQAMSEAGSALSIEKTLAHVSLAPEDSADPARHFNVQSVAKWELLAPSLELDAYLNQAVPRPIDKLNVTNTNYLQTVDQLIASLPIDTWKSYFRWHALSGSSEALPAKFRDENFSFWGANLGHQEKPLPRWKYCTDITDQAFGQLFAQEWSLRNLTPETRAAAVQLTNAVEKALSGEIRDLAWMSDGTKKTAQEKLQGIRSTIGLTHDSHDYSSLVVKRSDFLGNLYRQSVYERNALLSKLDVSTDTVGLDRLSGMPRISFSRTSNRLVIPAGAFQSPLFDASADPAAQFGGAGVSIAHELIHGFDSLGASYDGRGAVHDWQTADDRTHYEQAASCESEQYAKLVPQSDDPVERKPAGNRAVESIADDGGLRIAFRALMESVGSAGKTIGGKTDGYTVSQRFFLAFAQTSCETQTFFADRQSMSADPHSVGRVRINGAVQNFDEFGKAFGCAKGKPMYPETFCRVW